MELTAAELSQIENQLQSCTPAKPAVDSLIKHQGQLEATLEDMLVDLLGDGHRCIWSLFDQMAISGLKDEILDWFHTKPNHPRLG